MQSTLVPSCPPQLYGGRLPGLLRLGDPLWARSHDPDQPGARPTCLCFHRPLIADLGISRLSWSALYSRASPASCPPVGRQPTRRVCADDCDQSAAGGWPVSIWALCTLAGCWGIGFSVDAGPGSLSLASRYAINQWWVRRQSAERHRGGDRHPGQWRLSGAGSTG